MHADMTHTAGPAGSVLCALFVLACCPDRADDETAHRSSQPSTGGEAGGGYLDPGAAAGRGGGTDEVFVGELAAGDPVLDGGESLYDEYRVSVEAGATLRIAMWSADFDTTIMLRGPDGEIMGEDDDSGGGLNSVLFVRAEQGGTHVAIATSYGGGATGRYALHIATRPPGEHFEGGPYGPGDEYVEEPEEPQEEEVYEEDYDAEEAE